MNVNMGIIDRIIRIGIAITFLILFFTNHLSGTTAIVLLSLGVVFTITSLIGFCPLYIPIKLSTKRTKKG